jgi:PAS domain S-box-containing protein
MNTNDPDALPSWEPDASRSGAVAVLAALWEGSAPMAIVDRRLQVVRVNAAMARVTRAAPEAHVGRPAEETLGPLAPARALRATLETGVQSTAPPASLESEPGSGGTRWWMATIGPVRGDDGGVLGACVVLSDVTSRRRAEEAAREARMEAELAIQALMRLQAVTTSLAAALTPGEVASVVMEQGLGLLDAVAGSISWSTCSDELEVLDAFGYPERALVAWRRFAVDLPAPLAEAFRTARPVWIESSAAYGARYPHLASTGRPFQGASVAVPLVVSERVRGVLGVDFDAPRRFDAADCSFILAVADQAALALERARLYEQQQALRTHAEEAAALLDTMFSSVPIGLAFVDWDLRFVHANSAWGRLHGLAPQAFVGHVVTSALAGDAGTSRAARWRRILATGEPALDVEDSRADPEGPGRRTWLESCHPVVAGSDTVGLAVVAREVTRARRAEEFRNNLLGIVGHDLRNPLGAISGFAHFLRRVGGLDERQLRTIGRIEACAGKAARIAHDLLDLTRIESAQGLSIEPRPARADEICAATALEAETAFAGRQVRVTGAGDPAVVWDAARISQALSNLVVNAIEHGAPDRPVTVEWVAGADAVSLRVHNWGPPIPAAVLAQLFEPFRPGARAGARASGVGLGLYIVNEIARAHGGTLEVRSDDVEGTVFTLRLPRAPPR